MTAFHVGQRVCCISNGPIEYEYGVRSSPELNVGSVYTVKRVQATPEGIGLFLCEAEPPNGFIFDSRRFRPVVERKTSIAIFHEILNKHRTGVPA